MAEQFLDGPQIAAARQEMRRKGMAQGMRRRRRRQAERAAQTFDGELDDARRQRAAFGPDEQRSLRRKPIGTEVEIGLDPACHSSQNGDGARFAAFADHGQAVARADRRIRPPDREGFGNAQARTVEKAENGGIAGEHPGRPFVAGTAIDGGDFTGRGNREGLRQAAGEFRRPYGGKGAALPLPARSRWRAKERSPRASATATGCRSRPPAALP